MMKAGGQAAAIERRRSERTDLIIRVDYQTVDELFSDFVRDINEGGIFVESEAPHELGTSVDLQFRLPGNEEPVRVKGAVVRVSQGRDGDAPGMGIEFEGLDASTRQRINDLVRTLRTELSR